MLSIIPLLLTIPSIVYFFDNSLVLFPSTRYDNQIGSYASQNSIITDFRFDSKTLTFSYILRERTDGYTTPFGSVVFWLKRDDTFLDLSGYDYLSVEIGNATPKNVVIFIKTFEEGVSQPEKEKAHTLRHNEYTLQFEPGVSEYRINLSDFLTQDWWFGMLAIPLEKRHKESFTKVSALDFQFIHRSGILPKEKEEVFTFTNVVFRKSYPILYVIFDIAIVLYYAFLIGAIVAKKKRIIGLSKDDKIPPIQELQYKRLEIGNYAENELERITTYLREHYDDPKISSSTISSETGIPRSHITEIIKNRYDCTCKQLINRIRITEAKRLLKSTDRRILEVALEVGFEDISTFNRCFKQAEGTSPRQYRNG